MLVVDISNTKIYNVEFYLMYINLLDSVELFIYFMISKTPSVNKDFAYSCFYYNILKKKVMTETVINCKKSLLKNYKLDLQI